MKYAIMVIFGLFAAQLALAQSNDMQTIATVGLTKTEAITVKQLKNEVEALEKAMGKKISTREERRDVLDSMINQRLALQGAERDGIKVSDAETNQQINEIRSQYAARIGRNPTDAEFAEYIRQQAGLDIPAFREQCRKGIIVQKYLLAKKGDVIQGIKPPSEPEIKSFYEKNKSELVQAETLEFSALMLPYKTDSEKAKARTEANRLAREINGSADAFDGKVPQGRVSNAAFIAVSNELMPRNSPGMPDDFMNAAFSLERGKISEVYDIPTGDGNAFCIIKVSAKYPAKILGLDDIILIVPPAVKAQLQGRPLTLRMYIQTILAEQKQQEILIKAQEDLITELRKGNTFKINEQYLNY